MSPLKRAGNVEVRQVTLNDAETERGRANKTLFHMCMHACIQADRHADRHALIVIRRSSVFFSSLVFFFRTFWVFFSSPFGFPSSLARFFFYRFSGAFCSIGLIILSPEDGVKKETAEGVQVTESNLVFQTYVACCHFQTDRRFTGSNKQTDGQTDSERKADSLITHTSQTELEKGDYLVEIKRRKTRGGQKGRERHAVR